MLFKRKETAHRYPEIAYNNSQRNTQRGMFDKQKHNGKLDNKLNQNNSEELLVLIFDKHGSGEKAHHIRRDKPNGKNLIKLESLHDCGIVKLPAFVD